MKKIFTLCILFLAFNADGQHKKLERAFSNVKKIQLSTSSGNIVIKKASGAQVSLSITHSYSEGVFTPVIEERGGTLLLKEQFSRGNHSGSSEWSIAIPDNTSLTLNSGSGDIDLDGVHADVKTNLGSGDVKVASVTGDLSFNTGSGDIQLKDTQGDLAFNTGSGNIRAQGGTGTFRLNAGSGDIELSGVKGTFEVNTGSGDIESRDISLTGGGKFNSGSGDATIELSGSLDHSIGVASGSGNATLNFKGSEIDGLVIMTANERNGKISAPFKFDSEERIEERNSSPRIRKTAKLGTKDIRIEVSTGSGTAEIKR